LQEDPVFMRNYYGYLVNATIMFVAYIFLMIKMGGSGPANQKISTALKANYIQLPSQSSPCLQNALTPSPNMLPATGATIIAELGGSFNCSIIHETIDMPEALFFVSTFL
jgi:hypothetical protein